MTISIQSDSKKKMIYDEVDELLINDKDVDGYQPFKKTLYVLYDAALRLQKRYIEENGMIIFADTELTKVYNDDGTIESIAEHRESVSMDLIKYLMIAANETVANWFINLDIFSVFRNHDIPSANLINKVIF